MRKSKASPAKKWLLLLGVLCIGFLAYDFLNAKEVKIGENQIPAAQSASSTEAPPGEAEDKAQEKEPLKDILESSKDYYTQFQLEKEKARGQELELLNEIINNPNSTAEGKDKAQARAIALAKKVEDEMLIAALLAAKNFNEAMAFIQEDKVTVVLNGKLSDNEAQQIADLVDGVTNIGMERVVIINK